MTTSKRSLKPAKFFILCLTILTLFFNTPHPVVAEETYSRHYAWSYKGVSWTWDLTISKTLYQEYKNVPQTQRISEGVGGYGLLVTTQDTYIKQLTTKLHETATKKGYGAFDEVSFVLSFVQSLEYTSDSVTTSYDEYPRFPVETLVDNGGDCEDTSILFATIVENLGYGAIFINPPGHVAVGVKGGNLEGSYYTYQNAKYFNCETTGSGWSIGGIPDEYNGVKASLYSINTADQYIPSSGQISPLQPSHGSTTSTQQDNSWIGIIVFFVIGLAFYLAYKNQNKDANPKPEEGLSAPPAAQNTSQITEPIEHEAPSPLLDEPQSPKELKVESQNIPILESATTPVILENLADSPSIPIESLDKKYKFCIKCGSKLHFESVYCGVCGYKVPIEHDDSRYSY